MKAGGLIIIGLFLKHWSIVRCIDMFDKFTSQFFGVHLTKGKSFLTRLRDYIRCWISDGCYDVGKLEMALKEVFGVGTRMFDTSYGALSGTKVAVTATTISNAFACLFSNYNGVGTRDKKCGTLN